MKGTTYKRCTCPPQYDGRGRRKNCARRHGSWWYRLDIGTDPATGRRRQEAKGGYATQKDAQVALNDAIAVVQDGVARHDQRLTVAAYLSRWLNDKETVLRATTMKDYRRYVEDHINPHIGHLRLRDLRTSQVTTMLRDLAAAGLGATSVRRVHAVLRSALSDAVRAELVRSNAARYAIVTKRSRPKVQPWSAEELGLFLDHALSDEFGPIFEVIAGAGLRRGEALGLRWQDVDLRRGVVVVRQQIVQLDRTELTCRVCRGAHKGLTINPPKTASGEARRIELGQTVAGVLLTHRLMQDHQREVWQSAYSDHDLVFAQADGNPIHPERLTKRFGRLVKTSGLRPTRLHDLRHARASLLLASGTDIALVSKMLGHSSLAITADTYSHLLDGVGRRAAEAADAMVPRQPRSQSVHNRPSEELEARFGV